MPDSVIDLSVKFMRNPLKILVKHENLTLEGIRQFYINNEEDNYKLDTFRDLYDKISISQSIVYVNTKRRADMLKEELEKDKFTVAVIHSDMSSQERTLVINDFRTGKARILVSTDLLSRGIDVQQVSVVINYDLPNNKECYIHRIGRSGRFGRKGVAINFATNKDIWKIEAIEQFYSTQIEPMPQNINDIISSC
jgi:translation initiation factor 4A